MYHHLRPLRLTTLSHIAQKVLVTAPVDLVGCELVLGTSDTLEVLCLCLPVRDVLASIFARNASSVKIEVQCRD